MTDADRIIQFWQQFMDNPGAEARDRLLGWLNLEQAPLDVLREQFAALAEDALQGAIPECDDPERAALAKALLLGMFCHNLFRGEAKAYRGLEAAAAEAALLDQPGGGAGLSTMEKILLAMSGSNTEDLALHNAGIARLETLQAQLSGSEQELLTEFLELARRRRQVIDDFGRYPARNRVLGRASTPLEAYFIVHNSLYFN